MKLEIDDEVAQGWVRAERVWIIRHPGAHIEPLDPAWFHLEGDVAADPVSTAREN